MPLRTAVLQVPSKSYANLRKRSGIVQLSRNRGNERKSAKRVRTGWIFGRKDFWRGRGRIFGAATPPGALVHVQKVTVTFFFAPHALACRRKVQRDLKILATLRTAVLQVPSKSYENRTVRSAFVHFSRNRGN